MGQLIDNRIAELIEQTNAIASYVRLEDWATVGELSDKRQQNLEVFFQTPVKTIHAESVSKMIRQILSIDHEMVEFIEKEKKRTFNKFANLQTNNKANQTYKTVASLT